MKLAEALARRAEIQSRINELQSRAMQSARHQEGDSSPEDPAALLDQIRALIDELESVIRRINRVNATTPFDGGTVTDAIARRDALALRRRVIGAVADAAAGRLDRVTRSEIKFVTDLDVAALRREADHASRQHRELDVQLQETNWLTEVSEE